MHVTATVKVFYLMLLLLCAAPTIRLQFLFRCGFVTSSSNKYSVCSVHFTFIDAATVKTLTGIANYLTPLCVGTREGLQEIFQLKDLLKRKEDLSKRKVNNEKIVKQFSMICLVVLLICIGARDLYCHVEAK